MFASSRQFTAPTDGTRRSSPSWRDLMATSHASIFGRTRASNFLRTLATSEPIKDWSMTTLKERLIKIGAKVVTHGRYVAFQMAEVPAFVPRHPAADRGTASTARSRASG